MLPPLFRTTALFLAAALLPHLAPANVVINEIVSAASERALQWDAAGVPRIGTGATWYEAGFNDGTWRSGSGPFGYGVISGGPAYGTNTGTEMQYLTPTLYLRKIFSVSEADAARADQVQLLVEYNDGFICYLNGVEVARRWAGPAKQFHYHDQPAYRPNVTPDAAATNGVYTETISLGTASTRLVAGPNVLAIHALNVGVTNTTFLMKATLNLTGTPTTTLVNPADTWKYLPGVVEPSGNLYDPALLSSGRLKVPWAQPTGYDDLAWGSGPGPIGAGTASGVGSSVPGVIGQTPSIYLRAVFNVTAGQAADPLALRLLVDYDDGFVAYINGVEVARANVGVLPNTFTPANAVATVTRNNTGTQTTFTIDPANRVLQEGLNVLAIQVHNVSVNDPDLFLRADLRTNAGGTLVAGSQPWKYLAGIAEPVSTDDDGTEDSPEGPDYAGDWIELHNTGADPVSLAGWRLTDRPGTPNKWIFPADATIPAGGYLVVFCDGTNADYRAAGGYLHTNFKLSRSGDYLALRNQNGVLVQDFAPSYPPGSAFHSYGRTASGGYVYFDQATPGGPNAGGELEGRVADPVFSVSGGFHASSQPVTLTCDTPGATIRFTTNGTEPTATSGLPYTSPVNFANVAVRARAFKSGSIPSRTVTQTYLINQSAARRSLPAMIITADPGRSLYRPYGIFSIINNDTAANYSGGLWHAAGSPAQFNNPNLRGFFAERPGNLQLAYPDGRPGFNIDSGFRAAGSPYSRPRYVFNWLNSGDQNSASPFNSSSIEKPQVNVFFRGSIGGGPLQFPLFPGSGVTSFDNIRLRSGKNDISNPFVRDELTRRVFTDTGNVSPRGINATLWINGVYKGYYNPVERPRESFFQRSYNSDKPWDVWVINEIASGDNLMLQELVTYLRTHAQANPVNYQGTLSRLDVTNFIDYLLVNIYECMGDWPHNNYIMARERSAGGKWIFTIWDGEGSFGSFGGLTVRSNQFTPPAPANTNDQAKIVSNGAGGGDELKFTPRILYTLLRTSPEFRLHFADRIQKHFFHNGALTDARILARKNELRTEMLPLIPNFNDAGFNDWINGRGDITRFNGSTNIPSRRQVLLSGYTDDSIGGAFIQPHLVAEGLFPATAAPIFSQHGGNVAPGFQLTITNPNPSGTIYFTTNGEDPRAFGGAVQGGTYSSPISITQSTLARARVRNSNGEWSPLSEATFAVAQPLSVLITEIMYQPPSLSGVPGDEYEFLEVKNAGTSTLNLNGWQFTDAVSFTFAAGTSLAPGGFAVVARNATRFAQKYPGVSIAGVYAPAALDNSGGTIVLRDLSGGIVTTVTYSDSAPWPALPRGYGNSLVPVNPDTNANPNDPANWRASAQLGGSPGADDPAPSTAAILVNELLANSPSGQRDKVELFNPSTQAADLSDWYLSDNVSSPKKYRLPEGTILGAGEYIVFSEDHFNVPGGANVAFAFDGNGEEVRLSAADSAGNLTGYAHGFSFGASATGVPFGRHVNSVGIESFPAQQVQTFGFANAGPLRGPVVITEFMPQPGSGRDEFVELRNVSDSSIALYDVARPLHAWRLSGIGYTFPVGVVLEPNQFALVTPLSASEWRAKYGTPDAIAIYGPYAGNLSDSGERLALQMPGVPYSNSGGQTTIPYIDVDALSYQLTVPWPGAAAGMGASLERVNARVYADDPASWQASSGNGGSPGMPLVQSFAAWRSSFFNPAQLTDPAVSGMSADPDGDGISNLREYAHGYDPLRPNDREPISTALDMDGGNGPYLTLQFRRNLSATGLQFIGDTAATPGAWELGASVQVGAPINLGDGTERVILRDTVPSSEATQRYIRLRIIGN